MGHKILNLCKVPSYRNLIDVIFNYYKIVICKLDILSTLENNFSW